MRGDCGYLDADGFDVISQAVAEAARQLGNLSRDAAWVPSWRNWGNRGAEDPTYVRPVDMPYVWTIEERDYQARIRYLFCVDSSGVAAVTLSVGIGALVLQDPYDQLYCLRWRV